MVRKPGAFSLGQTPLSKGDQRYLERATAHTEHFAKSATAPASERAYSADAAGFEGFSAHSLRAGFPTSAMEHGADNFRAAHP
jgi:hypothetical protein